MKKSISHWSFPGVLSGDSAMSLKACMQLAKEAGFDAIELTLAEKGDITLTSTKADMEKITALSKQVGIELSSLATGLLWEYSLTSSDTATQEKGKTIVKKMLELASYLGVDTILVVPGAVDVFFKPGGEVVPYEVAYSRALDVLKELAPVAEKYKVNIGVENVWNKFLLSPLEMKKFIDEINSPFVGVYFDVGNVLATGYPEHWIRILGKRIKRVHLKDFKVAAGNVQGFVELLEGDVNWPEVMSALRESGYDGYLTAEIIPPYQHHPEALLYSTSKKMDYILKK